MGHVRRSVDRGGSAICILYGMTFPVKTLWAFSFFSLVNIYVVCPEGSVGILYA